MEDRFKFRAWVKSENVMIQHREVIERAHLQFEDRLGQDNDIVMQCTGLKDKNGKLIYEGDIVYFKEFHNRDDKDRGYGVVEFGDTTSGHGYTIGYCLNLNKCKQKNLRPTGFHRGLTGHILEVVGNIYENPELLNKMEKQ